jgi:hypothetical protein
VRALCFCVLAVLLSSCSLVFVQRPEKEGGSYRAAGCTQSRVAPILDTVFTTFQLARMGYAWGSKDQDYEGRPFSRTTDIELAAGSAVLGAISAIYGFVSVDDCRDLVVD